MGTRITRKLTMKFVTNLGDDFNVILNNAAEDLTEGEGAQAVADAMDLLMTKQPFTVTLSSKNGATVTEQFVYDVEFE